MYDPPTSRYICTTPLPFRLVGRPLPVRGELAATGFSRPGEDPPAVVSDGNSFYGFILESILTHFRLSGTPVTFGPFHGLALRQAGSQRGLLEHFRFCILRPFAISLSRPSLHS